jgi:hypothetical protein
MSWSLLPAQQAPEALLHIADRLGTISLRQNPEQAANLCWVR